MKMNKKCLNANHRKIEKVKIYASKSPTDVVK